MEHIIINGKRTLKGDVYISGAKNAAVAIIPAALTVNGVCTIENLPYIRDVLMIVKLIKNLGVKCEFKNKHTLIIDSRDLKSFNSPYESARETRASYYLMGVLLGRFKRCSVPLPGGCNFGVRPIDQHIKGLKALGATINIEHGVIKAAADNLIGTKIYLDVASVGATINIMLAAIHAKGVTVIENAAKEPHVVDTANFLTMAGANIKGAGTDIIKVVGKAPLKDCEYAIIPDQIECGTYMITAAATGGDIKVHNIIPKHMESLSLKLKEMGCEILEGDNFIRVLGSSKLKSVNIKTMTYPGFPTDLQPQFTAMLCTSAGSSIITETIWDNRFQYIDELKRLGAKITVDGRIAVIDGCKDAFTGAQVYATDLRAGAALIIAGLTAKGKTSIGNIKYIDRGYEDMVNKLSALGASIYRVDNEK